MAEMKWNKAISQIAIEAYGGQDTMLFAAMTYHKLYDPFVPMRDGNLAHEVSYEATDNKSTITHVVPYANRQYSGASFNFSKEKHPLASAAWDKAAEAAGKKEELLTSVQAYIKRGI